MSGERYVGWVILGAIALVGGAVLFTDLSKPALLRWDEATHGRIAVEMVQDGQYLVPRTEHQYREKTGKPVLGYWLIVLAAGGEQPGVLHVRLPGAIGGLLTLVLLFLICKTQSLGLAVFTGLSLLLFPGFLKSRLCWFENILNPLFLGAFWIYARAMVTVEWRRRLLHTALAGLLVGLSILTKNIYGLFPIMAVGLLELLRLVRQPSEWRSARSRVLWFGGAAFASSAWWFVYMLLAIGEPFVDGYLVTNTVGRFVTGSTLGQYGPSAYYAVLDRFTGWIPAWVCLVGVVLFYWHRLVGGVGAVNGDARSLDDDERGRRVGRITIDLITIFSVLHIVLLAFFAAKWRWWYLLTMLPFLALGAGHLLGEFVAAVWRARAMVNLGWVLPLAVITAIAAWGKDISPLVIVVGLVLWLVAYGRFTHHAAADGVGRRWLGAALCAVVLGAIFVPASGRLLRASTFRAKPVPLYRAAAWINRQPPGELRTIKGNIGAGDEYLIHVYFRRRVTEVPAEQACTELGADDLVFVDRKKKDIPSCLKVERRRRWGRYAIARIVPSAR